MVVVGGLVCLLNAEQASVALDGFLSCVKKKAGGKG